MVDRLRPSTTLYLAEQLAKEAGVGTMLFKGVARIGDALAKPFVWGAGQTIGRSAGFLGKKMVTGVPRAAKGLVKTVVKHPFATGGLGVGAYAAGKTGVTAVKAGLRQDARLATERLQRAVMGRTPLTGRW